MSEPADLWRKNLSIWAALLALLVLTFALARLRIGAFNTAIGLGISAVKAALVLTLFMQLRRSRVIVSLAAAAGVIWLGFLFVLTFADVMAR
jgi:cytochrome c oxidase subunit 4